jgi:polyribonucleotide nucleotidyltransferase
MGRVVNITKFGAFINILPGRDGLVHISKLGGGKRINSVEDVLSLGDEIEVVVEEIDDRGKVSLVPAGDLDIPTPRPATVLRLPRAAVVTGTVKRLEQRRDAVSFEAAFDAELASELGDLGPVSERPRDDDDRGGRGGDRGRPRRGGDRGRGGGRRHR